MVSLSVIAAALADQRAARPECNWIAIEWGGSGRIAIVPELPAQSPAIYDGWPWSALAGYQRTRRELRALGFASSDVVTT